MKVSKKALTAAAQTRRAACPKCGRTISLRGLLWRHRCPWPRGPRAEVKYTPGQAEAHINTLRQPAVAAFAERMGDPSRLEAIWLPSAVERKILRADVNDVVESERTLTEDRGDCCTSGAEEARECASLASRRPLLTSRRRRSSRLWRA